MNDRNHDIIGARNAGIDSIAVAYGYGSVEELKNAEPTFIANSVEEIEGILNVSFVK
jgi:phosphoglycolate phosphatase